MFEFGVVILFNSSDRFNSGSTSIAIFYNIENTDFRNSCIVYNETMKAILNPYLRQLYIFESLFLIGGSIFGQTQRRSYYFIYNSIQTIINIVLLFLIGSIIVYSGGYKATFLISFCIYMLIIFMPPGHNKIPQISFSLSDLKKLISQEVFLTYGLNKVLVNGADSLNIFIFAIVPFLILKNEFSLGMITSIIGILAAILSLIDKNFELKKQLSFAYIGSIIRIIVNTAFIIFFSTPVLVIRSIVITILSTFTDPVMSNVDINNTSKLLHHDKKDAIEINIIDETLALIGKMIALMLFLAILNFFSDDKLIIVKVVIFSYGVWKLTNFFWLQRINKLIIE